MNLNQYFQRPDAMSMTDLRLAIGAGSDEQIKQWRYGYANRKPSPENAARIELATCGLVKRWDLRPDDWSAIWPELIGAEGAPAVAGAD